MSHAVARPCGMPHAAGALRLGLTPCDAFPLRERTMTRDRHRMQHTT